MIKPDQITVLVTGADGFIGRHVAPYLAARGLKVSRRIKVDASTFRRPADIVSRTASGPIRSQFDWHPLLAALRMPWSTWPESRTDLPTDDLYDRVNRRAAEALASGRVSLAACIWFSSRPLPLSPARFRTTN